MTDDYYGFESKFARIAAEIADQGDCTPEYLDELNSRLAREAVLIKLHWFNPDLCPCDVCEANRQEIERIRALYET